MRGYYFKALISETKSSVQRRSFRASRYTHPPIKERFASMTELTFAIGLVLLGVIIWLFARHAGPTSMPAPLSRAFRTGLNHSELIDWLETEEAALPIVAGAESRILLASPSKDGNGFNPKGQDKKPLSRFSISTGSRPAGKRQHPSLSSSPVDWVHTSSRRDSLGMG